MVQDLFPWLFAAKAAATSTSFWLYLAIPVSSALVGWGTNVLAIKMMFYPLEFVGKRPIWGWQGIIPSKAAKMAALSVDMMMSKLLSVDEMFDKIDPHRVAEEMEPTLNQMAERIIEEVISESYPRLWETVPRRVKDKTIARIRDELPGVIQRMMQDIKENIDELCDVRTMVIDAFTRNKALLNELFQRCGEEEFKFIGRSGLYFGFAFGLIQMTIWIFVKPWWLLPLAGLFVGYATNWLALKMVFEPLEPKQIGPFRWQGLFLKRQKEVSEEYAELFAKEVINPENIFEALLRGPASDQLFSIIQRHLKQAIDDASGISKPFIQWVVGTERYIEMKNTLSDRLLADIHRPISKVYDYTEEALDVKNQLVTKMQALTSHEFEEVLHPIFEEDEWILIAVGAALGLAVGFFQLFALFGG